MGIRTCLMIKPFGRFISRTTSPMQSCNPATFKTSLAILSIRDLVNKSRSTIASLIPFSLA